MSHYIAFLKKELLENIRTYKMLIMLLLFFIFGIMSPLTAKLTPDLLNALAADGVSITIADPTALDSWTQFFKNTSQMGLIITVIVFSGILGTEISKGTLINILTKGLSRRAVILSKYTSMSLIWTISLLISFLSTWAYTAYLFPGSQIKNLFFSTFCLWLFGILLLSLLLFAATITKNSYSCLLLTGAGVVICLLAAILPTADQYNPLSLTTKNMDLLTNTTAPSTLHNAIYISILLTIALISSALLIFKKKQI